MYNRTVDKARTLFVGDEDLQREMFRDPRRGHLAERGSKIYLITFRNIPSSA